MKKILLISIIVVFAINYAEAQFYISGTGGYSFAANEKTLGSSTTASGVTDLEGSYGEGIEVSLRGGYHIHEKWAIELGLGYLHGSDQDVQSLNIPGASADLDARGRAYGAFLAGVYNVTDKFYVKAGILTKIGGRTEANAELALEVPAQMVNPDAPDGATVPLMADFTTDFNGKIPAGIVGAIGYKIPVTDKFNFFAEVEYMGISVTRDVSNSSDFSASLAGDAIDRATLTSILSTTDLNRLIPLYSESEVKWGENGLPSSDAPYSSIGINFGVTYSFDN
ncbi:outer membrane beta-barrel protein [Gracilimonas mengyeensis]|uniref:Outer membrane protein beta-barrel domain-containing protein n=1 Tax=Gracilimonas mengyeensis TaxID=1302730 RepID=A0A521C2V3_9BACT|nr:outer membrane beta-barrel protein [Gracilimonas mengyeensis]SMO53665.1 Outer membrane protein beta-barrel domain-containing protein [Gracilimonas mengyeensis]